jgi:hypothetical protein
MESMGYMQIRHASAGRPPKNPPKTKAAGTEVRRLFQQLRQNASGEAQSD